jgi:hypothetical protein
MFMQSITKRRVAAAVATLSISGAGLAMSGFGVESSTQATASGKAGTPGEQQAATVSTGSENAINGARVHLVARPMGFGRFKLGWATPASGSVTGVALDQGSATAGEVGTAVGETNDQARRPRGTRMPQRVEITLPSYEGGRSPSATAPAIDRGTAPSVDPGWKTTIDLGEAPHVGSPSVDPGEMGTFHPPTVNVS